MSAPFVLAIGGPSGAGKAFLVAALAHQLPPGSMAVLSLDDYYRDLAHVSPAERALRNFDQPSAFEHRLAAAHLRALRSGRAVCAPVYDFANHARTARTRTVLPAPVVAVEGTLALHWPALREQADLRVYIEAAEAECLRRRIERDGRERGRTPDDVVRQFEATVRPMATAWVLPTRAHADLVVSGEDDALAGAAAVIRLLPPRLR